MKPEIVIGVIVVVALGGGALLLTRAPAPTPENTPVATPADTSAQRTFPSAAEKAPRFPKAPELISPDGYINTPDGMPITIGEFRGKNPVLIDIWTYSCINCQRTLPYLRAWHEKYADKGLVIIGVHTPEFAFEKVQANVEQAVKDFGLKYPVVLDNDYRTWNAFGNRFWPRKYLIDIDGYIVYDHAGEGAYEEAERAIQEALEERAVRLGGDMGAVAISKPHGVVEVDYAQLRSPEIYFGSARNERLGNGTQGVTGPQMFEVPSSVIGNTLYLGGVWNFTPEYAENTSTGAKVVFKYGAKNVYFVARTDTPVTLKVTRDGQEIGSARGVDVSAEGTVIVGEDRLYHLVGDTEYGVHTLDITIEGVGLEAYTFTFG